MSKTYEGGTKRKDAKHIYANPFEQDLCVILAFGVYFAYNPTIGGGSLYPGSSQRDR
ncbi:unnamed protein product, partial [Aphanomyces euteiches]